MKEYPILFSAPMPTAILKGRKTKTRRILNSSSPEMIALLINVSAGINIEKNKAELTRCYSPYGQPGDLLYVRESYYQYGEWKYTDLLTKGGKVKSEFIPLDEEIMFNPWITIEEEIFNIGISKNSNRLPAWYKRLGRFMPKKYSRIWLKVSNINVERLHDISEEDAIAEGIEPLLASRTQLAVDGQLYRDYLQPVELFNDGLPPIESFKSLWISINGQESWDENPWVWVVSFEVLSTTGKPSL